MNNSKVKGAIEKCRKNAVDDNNKVKGAIEKCRKNAVDDNNKVKVAIEKCRANAIIPVCAREGDAGMDVCAAENVDIYPGQTKLVRTGLKMAIPVGYEIQVRPRSGLSYKTSLRIANSPGTIDSGYRDEISVIMQNTGIDCYPYTNYDDKQSKRCDNNNQDRCCNDNEVSNEASSQAPVCELSGNELSAYANSPCVYRIKAGDRIAQIILAKLPSIEFVVLDSVADIGNDRQGGFGSSGVK